MDSLPQAAPRDQDLDPLEAELAGVDSAASGLVGLTTDWSVPWSDLMMVLFVLFVVLYCYDRAERAVPEAFRADAPLTEELGAPTLRDPSLGLATPGDVFEQGRAAVGEIAPGEVDVVLDDDDSVVVRASGETFFDLGKAELRPETRALLDRLVPVIADVPWVVVVSGHTDSFPISSERFATNWELSAARATRVARYLIERGQLDPARFTVKAHALYRPAVPNDSAANKARNRRVEIAITRRLPPAGPEVRP